jgi:hypothetical protein
MSSSMNQVLKMSRSPLIANRGWMSLTPCWGVLEYLDVLDVQDVLDGCPGCPAGSPGCPSSEFSEFSGLSHQSRADNNIYKCNKLIISLATMFKFY